MELNKIYQGDCLSVLKTFPDEFIDCVITSPPYWALRDYGVEGQIGLEDSPEHYVNKLCEIFDEIKRCLKPTGTIWVNLGDTYGGSNCGYGQTAESTGFQNVTRQTYYPTSKSRPLASTIMQKSLLQIPSRFAIEMCDRGWILRNELIWYKPNCMPSSVKDRFTVDFEKIYFFTKNKKYYFETQREPHSTPNWEKKPRRKVRDNWVGVNVGNSQDKAEGYHPDGRNKRCVWKITTKPFREAHFATFPEDLVETPIKAGSPEKGVVLDPFMGAGTTAVVAKKLNRQFIGIELNPEYIQIAYNRIIKSLEEIKNGNSG